MFMVFEQVLIKIIFVKLLVANKVLNSGCGYVFRYCGKLLENIIAVVSKTIKIATL